MENTALEQLKNRFEFDKWRNQNGLLESLFVRGFFIDANVLPDWTLHRKTIVPNSPRPTMTTVWKSNQNDDLLRIDFIETVSRAAAHEMLIEVTSHFQSPLLQRHVESDIGDVAFGIRQGEPTSVVAFARANLVFVVAGLSPKAAGVAEAARRLDEFLVQKPEEAAEMAPERSSMMSDDARPMAARFHAAEGLDSGALPLVGKMFEQAEPALVKVYSATGEVFERDGQPVYESRDGGKPDVTVFTIERQSAGPLRCRQCKVE